MAGRRREKVISSFYCINCGKRGIPVWRDVGRRYGPGHRKALYCTNCKLTINHVEVRTTEEEQKFLEDYAAGIFTEEAEKSVAYAKEHHERG